MTRGRFISQFDITILADCPFYPTHNKICYLNWESEMCGRNGGSTNNADWRCGLHDNITPW